MCVHTHTLSPISLDYRIHRLHPSRRIRLPEIELNCNAWNKTVLTFKLCTYAHLNCLKWISFCMLNWIVWNGSVFVCSPELFEMDQFLYAHLNCLKWISFCMLNWIVWNRTILTFNCVKTKSILILNWIFWIRTVWLNWITWNRNVFYNFTEYLC